MYFNLSHDRKGKPSGIVATCMFDENALIRSVLPCTWDNNQKAWVLSLSPEVVHKIVHYFGQQTLHPSIVAWIKTYEDQIRNAMHIAALEDATISDKDINARLFPYQRVGVKFMKEIGSSILADETGLGKTWQGVGLGEEYPDDAKLLYVVPSVVARVWKEAIEDLTNGKQVPALAVNKSSSSTKKAKDKRADAVLSGAKYTIINYEAISYTLDALKQVKYDMVYCDEAHVLRNRTKLYKMVKELEYDNIVLATATPIMNSVMDIFSLMTLVRPAEYTSYWQFANKYCIIEENNFGKKVVGLMPGAEDDFRKDLSRFLIRREKKRVLKDLPGKVYKKRYVELNKEQEKLYKEMLKDMKISVSQVIEQIDFNSINSIEDLNSLKAGQHKKLIVRVNDRNDLYFALNKLSGIGVNARSVEYTPADDEEEQDIVQMIFPFIEAITDKSVDIILTNADDETVNFLCETYGGMNSPTLLAQMTRLRQIAISPKLIDSSLPEKSSKMDEVYSLIEELLIQDKKIVIMSQFNGVYERILMPYLDSKGINYVMIAGGKYKKNNHENMKKFQSDPDVRIALCNSVVAGVAITLTASDNMIFIDRHFNPKVNEQAEDRINRIGQKNEATIHDIIVENTAEERVWELIGQKTEEAQRAMNMREILEKVLAEEMIAHGVK